MTPDQAVRTAARSAPDLVALGLSATRFGPAGEPRRLLREDLALAAQEAR